MQLVWGVLGAVMDDPIVGDLTVLLGCIQISDLVGAFMLFGYKLKHWRLIKTEFVIAFWPTYVPGMLRSVRARVHTVLCMRND
jgi:hypothetical protein